MAGKPGRSGPPGNLNGVKRKWDVFWRRRALAPEDRWIGPVLEDYGDQLLTDKGGPDVATAGERRTIEIAQTARGAAMLILAEARRSGFIRKVDGSWDLAPGAKELARFLRLEAQALQALGFQRAEPKSITLADIQREYEGRGRNG